MAVASWLHAVGGISPFKFTTNWNNDRVAVKFAEDKKITVECIDFYRN